MTEPTSDAPPKRKGHFALLREFALADFITLANAAAGMGAILACLAYLQHGQRAMMWMAIALFPIALVCDVADGSVARWRRRSSPYGADLDSLADIVSFGVGPAVLGFTLGLDGGWDVPFLLYFVGCGISRLARFNATAETLMTDAGKVSHFEGTPIPTSLLVVAVLGAAFGVGATGDAMWLGELEIGPSRLHPLVALYALSGTAMISARLKIPKP